LCKKDNISEEKKEKRTREKKRKKRIPMTSDLQEKNDFTLEN